MKRLRKLFLTPDENFGVTWLEVLITWLIGGCIFALIALLIRI